MRIVCISDTHARHHFTVVPDGDVLIHGGDITRRGSLEDVESFDRWLGTLSHKHKIVICGNHDFCFQESAAEARARITNAMYLQDSGCEIDGISFYGSPWQPYFGGWAFNLPRGEELAKVWAEIPVGVDVKIYDAEGDIPWPLVLREDKFAHRRKSLESLLIQEGVSKVISHSDVVRRDIRDESSAWLSDLQQEITTYHATDYLAGRQFLVALRNQAARPPRSQPQQ